MNFRASHSLITPSVIGTSHSTPSFQICKASMNVWTWEFKLQSRQPTQTHSWLERTTKQMNLERSSSEVRAPIHGKSTLKKKMAVVLLRKEEAEKKVHRSEPQDFHHKKMFIAGTPRSPDHHTHDTPTITNKRKSTPTNIKKCMEHMTAKPTNARMRKRMRKI